MACVDEVHSAPAKNVPPLADLCHPGILITWPQRAPESESLRWVNNGYKLKNIRGNGNLKMAIWHLPFPWQTLAFSFHVPSPTTVHFRWLGVWVDVGREPAVKFRKVCHQCLTCQVRGKTFCLQGPQDLPVDLWTPVAGLHLVSSLFGFSVHSCYCTYIFWVAWCFPLLWQWQRMLENMLPTWGIHSRVSSDQGTCFTGQTT